MPAPDPVERPDDVPAFLLRLGVALNRYGASSERLEDSLQACARPLGAAVQLFSTPTSLFVAAGEPPDQRTHLARFEPGEVDLGRLAELDALVGALATGEVGLAEAGRRLDALDARPPTWGAAAVLGASALASATAARIFGGGWREVLVAGALGLAVGALGRVFTAHRGRRRVLELGAALLATAGALLVAAAGLPVATELVTVSALIVLVPGLTLTVAMRELAARHLVPGSVGFRSMESFLASDAVAGVEAAFRAGIVAAALVGGLLTAHVLVPPRDVVGGASGSG